MFDVHLSLSPLNKTSRGKVYSIKLAALAAGGSADNGPPTTDN